MHELSSPCRAFRVVAVASKLWPCLSARVADGRIVAFPAAIRTLIVHERDSVPRRRPHAQGETMSKITDYRVIQADGARALGEAVREMIGKGWEPHGSVILVATKGPGTVPAPAHQEVVRVLCQPIVKHEPEHAELARLREMERLVGQIDDEIDLLHDSLPAGGMVAYIQELLAKALRRA